MHVEEQTKGLSMQLEYTKKDLQEEVRRREREFCGPSGLCLHFAHSNLFLFISPEAEPTDRCESRVFLSPCLTLFKFVFVF